MSDQIIDTIFPLAQSEGYSLTSPEDHHYNCIAWAAEINNRLMWPNLYGFFWPAGIKNENSLEAFIEMYSTHGYKTFTPENAEFEEGYLKVAIYVDQFGTPTHAARQLPNGKWTSKLGSYKDIEHNSLQALEGTVQVLGYGKVAKILRKSI